MTHSEAVEATWRKKWGKNITWKILLFLLPFFSIQKVRQIQEKIHTETLTYEMHYTSADAHKGD